MGRIIAIKTERTPIHFLSEVLVAVASLDLKVPNGYGQLRAGVRFPPHPLLLLYITALFKNTRILKFKSQLPFAFFAAVNHLSGPLKK